LRLDFFAREESKGDASKIVKRVARDRSHLYTF